ncbi:MAG: MerR family transcriptional regulator [Dehalococcoidia bacterium]|nr:MerR family transcriptional regulator [Dehalococcoidia bacterium]
MTMIYIKIDGYSTNIYRSLMQYTVRAAALATGVSGDRIRTWERRYGVPSPARSSTGRRMYEEIDLAIIRRMVALVDSGLSAVSAAKAVHEEAAQSIVHAERAPAVDPLVMTLVDSAATMDEWALIQRLDAAERSLGIQAAVEQVALPALVEAGRRWERSDITVAAEHILTEVIRSWLAVHSRALPSPAPGAAAVLVACPEDERHDLGALSLALLLRQAGLRVAYLGADVPTTALVDAVRTRSFDALCLSITGVSSLPVARIALSALLSAGGGMRLYIGGQGVTRASNAEVEVLPAVRLPASVAAAADFIAAQLQGTRGLIAT